MSDMRGNNREQGTRAAVLEFAPLYVLTRRDTIALAVVYGSP